MSEPVVHRRANPPAFDRRIARPVMTGDEQDDALAAVDRSFERAVDRPPGVVEVEPVEIHDPIRLDRAQLEPTVPAAVEGATAQLLPGTGRGTIARSAMVEGASSRSPNPLHRLWRFPSPFRGGVFLARQGFDRRRNLGPELGLFRAERAHGQRRPWAAGSAHGRMPTFRRPARPPLRRRPRRCRSGSVP